MPMLIAMTGAALGGSGAAYQGVFRNPLADPYLIGVASGAGLGAVAGMAIPWPSSMLGLYTIPAAAFAGAIITVALVYSLARVGRPCRRPRLILSGVAISSFASSLTSLLMLRSNDEIRRAMGWLLGGSIIGGWEPVSAILPYIVVGLAMLIASGHALNVLQFGEDQAQQLGLPAERAKTVILLAASLTTAAAVAFSGVIGFIGLIVPHVIACYGVTITASWCRCPFWAGARPYCWPTCWPGIWCAAGAAGWHRYRICRARRFSYGCCAL